MASSGFDEEVGELLLCRFLSLLRNLSSLLLIFPQVVDQLFTTSGLTVHS